MKKIFLVFALCFVLGSTEAQTPSAEAAVQDLLDEMTAAWNRGDAAALASHVESDITFTILDGSVWEGRDVFEDKHRGIFAGAFKGTTMTFKARRVKLMRPDVALVDVDTALSRAAAPPLRSSLLLVLQREGRDWMIAAFHNTAQRSPSAD